MTSDPDAPNPPRDDTAEDASNGDGGWDELEATLAAETPVFTRAPDFAISMSDILSAAERLRPEITRTPLLEFPILNAMVGGRVVLKLETLQLGGSFKARGAFNRLMQLTDDEKRVGVVAWSSGNHALAVALAARRIGTRATIVMPHDAPAVKVFATRAQGAEVVFYHRQTEDREAIARAICKERGAVLVPSYDDPDVIAGQGTCGLEIIEQATALDLNLDAVLVCCSGGGLAAGVATAVKYYSPRTAIYTVEPEGYDDMARSLSTGEVEDANLQQPTICDALQAPRPGELTLPILQHFAAGGLAVTDAEVRETMRYAFSVLKLVIEPGGAAALAALLARKLPAAGKTVAVVVSGGNVNPEFFGKVIAGRE